MPITETSESAGYFLSMRSPSFTSIQETCSIASPIQVMSSVWRSGGLAVWRSGGLFNASTPQDRKTARPPDRRHHVVASGALNELAKGVDTGAGRAARNVDGNGLATGV